VTLPVNRTRVRRRLGGGASAACSSGPRPRGNEPTTIMSHVEHGQSAESSGRGKSGCVSQPKHCTRPDLVTTGWWWSSTSSSSPDTKPRAALVLRGLLRLRGLAAHPVTVPGGHCSPARAFVPLVTGDAHRAGLTVLSEVQAPAVGHVIGDRVARAAGLSSLRMGRRVSPHSSRWWSHSPSSFWAWPRPGLDRCRRHRRRPRGHCRGDHAHRSRVAPHTPS
jgi:hypothetical protein